MTHVELDEITKRFDSPSGEIVAVDDLSLEVEDGEFLVLLGPSGCGKTTTLRMIGGLETPSEGDIRFDGTRVNDIKARNRDVAMVFQDFALYPHMTIERNLAFGLERGKNGLSSEEIEQKVTDAAVMLDIQELLDKKPSALSGGQKQRVALGRAIVREPELFLFDEPLANLDAQLRKTMRTEIVELQSRVDVTSAYVTHNQEEAMTIADKIAILDDGELQQFGTPSEIFNEPQNLFVAQFVGSPNMNVFDATLTEEADAYRVELADSTFTIDEALVGETDATDIKAGIRPQDLVRSASSARRRGHGGPQIDSEVNVIETLGTDAIVHTTATDGDLTATVTQFHEISEGESVQFTVDPRHVYLFERETERLIKGRMETETSEANAADEVEA